MILCETLNQKNCHLIQVSNQIKSQVQSAQLHMISYDDIVLNLQSSRKGKKISYMKPIVIRYSLVILMFAQSNKYHVRKIINIMKIKKTPRSRPFTKKGSGTPRLALHKRGITMVTQQTHSRTDLSLRSGNLIGLWDRNCSFFPSSRIDSH